MVTEMASGKKAATKKTTAKEATLSEVPIEHAENRLSPALYLGTLVCNSHHHRDELYQE